MTVGKVHFLGLILILIGTLTLTISKDATAFVTTLIVGIPALLTKTL